MQEKTVRLNIRLSPLDHDRLKALAKYRQWSMSHVIRDLIRDDYQDHVDREDPIDNVY